MKSLMTAMVMMAIMAFAANVKAQGNDDEAELRAMLDAFLEGASVGDAGVHGSFWAEELIYTSSSGTRFGKDTIMAGLESADDEPEEDSGSARYWAEEVQVRQYGDTAVVAFRLMAEMKADQASEPENAEYFNTGTFLRRDGQWRVVAWQATRIPAE